ncbi:DUF397 domain-containing protein [Alloactinosynnema sp. L-07]|uniref:DUF397 domain-containing protein n=1 Tax=Alloactinosynnema sp. L-07 TaxID=1653480 RepID=UPI0006B56D12|nr:DUF397 domain-containing protein [Alloactinosynnema sp. L-07]
MDLGYGEWRKSSRSSQDGCVEVAWRKSSRSGQEGCVEVAWHKSSRSGQDGCVEVAHARGRVGVRDSKHPAGGVISLAHSSWRPFVDLLTTG